MPTVRVGCKLPHGLVMELVEPGPMNMPSPIGKRVLLKGSNSTHVVATENPLVARFAFTDVEEEFAKLWFKRNEDALFIKNGSVFMERSEKDSKAAAKERSAEATGLEPMKPDKDSRIPKGVEADKDQLKRLGVA